jgi:hypothetical protein
LKPTDPVTIGEAVLVHVAAAAHRVREVVERLAADERVEHRAILAGIDSRHAIVGAARLVERCAYDDVRVSVCVDIAGFRNRPAERVPWSITAKVEEHCLGASA